eukprot:TRINITY_DN10522_c0_g1_i9.p2 TRINITY_DN10522_c0_g1~~TRINITY_DN10522_c0_g1_i9.p2  ORF type:complete len:263 (+),score=20.59 TRINITY_DN10522_c0_g1_i9:190-978(+)
MFKLSLQYDHNEFPGVVPRTFLGALPVAAIAAPLAKILPKDAMQIAARLVLGAIVAFAQHIFIKAIRVNSSFAIARWYAGLIAAQFHFNFYASRPLPNTFALVLVLLAYASILRRQWSWFTALIAIAVPVFRAELIALAGPFFLWALVTRRLSLSRMLSVGIPTGLLAISVSVLVDSIFWQRWLWPEGEVLYYNTILNKSKEWGTQPLLWYFYSVLPRALTVSLPLCVLGTIVSPKIRYATHIQYLNVLQQRAGAGAPLHAR